MNSQTSTKKSKAQLNKNTTEFAENISVLKGNQNIQSNVPHILSQVLS